MRGCHIFNNKYGNLFLFRTIIMNSIENIYNWFLKNPLISTDSRLITSNAIYFALKGDSFDGNAYAKDAIEKGACLAVIDNKAYEIEGKTILVENTLNTLQELAIYHRNHLNIPVIGITGTNGKTTTKELINAVLQKKFKTIATKGNLNNHIGVPLTVMSIQSDTEIAIIEMGANHIGEIDFLCKIAQPDFGIITNIGKAHLEGFGSYEGVVKAKSELYKYLKISNSKAFVNTDDEVLLKLSEDLKIVPYGMNNQPVSGTITGINPFITMQSSIFDESFLIKTKLTGRYNAYNILAAMAVGNYFEISPQAIQEAIKNYIPTNNRSQIKETPHNTLIMDAYNANPTSMREALNNLFEMESNRDKVAILGDMFELGNISEKEHSDLLDYVYKNGFERLMLLGKMFFKVNKYPQYKSFESIDDLKSFLNMNKLTNKLILLKGSRGNRLEQLEDYF